MNDDMKKAPSSISPREDIPSEIQHPSDLITMPYYWELTMLLLQLRVLPDDVHLITSKYWEEYEI